MDDDDEHGRNEDLVVVSDLHLGPGAGEDVETFYNDNAFTCFLEYLQERPRDEARKLRLVIVGDFVDLLRAVLVTNASAGPLTEPAAVSAIDRIIAGHPKVFRSLKEFLRSGYSIDIVIGNHDSELVRPALQERLRGVLSPEGPRPGSLSFHHWIYYVPGLLYAEHGHQHDDLNCFSTILHPFDDDDGKVLERPIGSYLFSEAERLNAALDPCPDHASSVRRYFALAARRNPKAARAALGRKAELAVATIRRAQAMSGPEREERRARYRREILPSYAESIGLSPESVLAIDELSAASKSPQRALAAQAVSRLRPSGPPGPLGRRVKYLESASLGVHDVLTRDGQDVPFYVFGHSHGAQHLPLDFGPQAPQYLNTGTWSSIVSPSAGTLRTVHPTFVHVVPSRNGSPPAARLLAWNSATGSPETLRTQA